MGAHPRTAERQTVTQRIDASHPAMKRLAKTHAQAVQEILDRYKRRSRPEADPPRSQAPKPPATSRGRSKER